MLCLILFEEDDDTVEESLELGYSTRGWRVMVQGIILLVQLPFIDAQNQHMMFELSSEL